MSARTNVLHVGDTRLGTLALSHKRGIFHYPKCYLLQKINSEMLNCP